MHQNHRKMNRKNSHAFVRTPTSITLASTTDEKEYAKSRKSMRGKFEDFCSETSFTPVSHVYKAGSVWKKLVWVVVSLGLTSYMTYQCQKLVTRYLQYPSEVDMELAFSPELDFPSVTICNLNPIRYSALMDSHYARQFAVFEDDGTDDLMYKMALSRLMGSGESSSEEDLIPRPTPTMGTQQTNDPDTSPASNNTGFVDDVTEEITTDGFTTGSPDQTNGSAQPPTPPSDPPPSRRRRKRATQTNGNWTQKISNTSYNQWELLDDNLAEEFYGQRASHNKAIEQFSKLVASLPADVIAQMGHHKQDFILSCRWQGYFCSPQNFTSFVNYKYGNCFTFNVGINMTDGDSGLMTSSPGPLYGLVLEMFMEQDEYTPSISPEAGARVVIHQRGKIPFPEDEGFTVSPGFLTSVGMRKTSIARLPQPHGNCSVSFKDVNSLYDDQNAIYSKQACMKSCLQQTIINSCKCGVTSYPIPNNVSICATDDEQCTSDVEDAYKRNDLGCDQKCPLPCNDQTHTLTISNAAWPARMYEPDLMSRLLKSSAKMMEAVLSDEGESSEDYIKDVAKVEIFYQELNYQNIQQKASYEFESLLSDVGGQLGLWLGVSILALGEIIDFILSACHYFLFKMADRKMQNPRSTPILPYRPPETES